MAVRDDIAQYISHFRAQNQEIEQIAIAQRIFREVLYLVEIDTLSRAAFPLVSGNRKRVVQFIDTCSNWNDKDKVSAVQLKLALEENGTCSGQLYDSVNRSIN
jgi:3-methyladenine DNA glycosylase AlkD